MRRTWLSEPVVVGLMRAVDCGWVLAASLLALATRFSTVSYLPPVELYATAIGVLLVPYVFSAAGLHSLDSLRGPSAQLRRLLVAWTLIILVLLVMGFLTKTTSQASRLWVSLWFVYGAGGLVAARLVFRYKMRHWRRAGLFTEHVVIVGEPAIAERLVRRLRDDGRGTTRVLGFFHTDGGLAGALRSGVPVLGGLDDVVRFARGRPLDKVVVALCGDRDGRLDGVVKVLRDLPVDVHLWNGVDLPSGGYRMDQFEGLPTLRLCERPLAGWGYVVKSLEDVVLASLILVLISPLLVLIALAIRLESRGPVFFRQRRYGFNNEVIEVLKFRTMHIAAERDLAVRQASRDDPRVTWVGRWLRRTSLDELPQLINVLRGEMSLVGPRPHALVHNDFYASAIDAYFGRHRVKPGITGWAQVNGLRGETETLEKMERRVQYDLYYIENWSLRFDIWILTRTLFVGFVHPNAY